jgi:hypothetical protein
MRKHVATTLGFLIAPLFAAIAFLAVGVAKNGPDLVAVSALVWTVIFYCYTLGATLIVGVPVFLVLIKFNKVSWWSAALVGIFGGAITAFTLINAMNSVFMVIGGLSGLVFWLIWRRGQERK